MSAAKSAFMMRCDVMPPWRPAWMDDEQVIAAALEAQSAASLILSFAGSGDVAAPSRRQEVAVHLAEALHAVISWMDAPDMETRELHGALEGFLP